MADLAFDDAIDRLHAVELEDFVPERTRLARELRTGGDRAAAAQLAKLPKPTAAAWALNHVAREDPGAVEEWLGAAEELREASTHAAQVGGDRVRAAMLGHREATTRLVSAVADRARPGGKPLSEAMLDRVRALLQAATADARVAELLRAGRVTEEPGEQALAAVAPAAAPPAAPPAEKGRKRAKAAEPDPEPEPAEPEPEPEPAPKPKRKPKAQPAPKPKRKPKSQPEPEPEPEPEPDPEAERRAARRADLEAQVRAAEEAVERLREAVVDRDAEADAADDRLEEARRGLRRAESEAEAAHEAVAEAEEAAADADRELRRLRGVLRRAGG